MQCKRWQAWKNKIKRFSNGDFSKEQPEVKFSETNLVLLIGEGETYQGSFTIESKKGSADKRNCLFLFFSYSSDREWI